MTWKQDYLAGLQKRDEREKTNHDIIDAYSKLADTVAVLKANESSKRDNAGTAAGDVSAQAETDSEYRRLKLELAEALRANGQLQSRLKASEESRIELESKNKSQEQQLKVLQSERATLAVKVKDRDEELKGKTQMLVEVQDENMFLILQLNVAEQKSAELVKENKQLVDRWMARIGQEAEAMNNALHR